MCTVQAPQDEVSQPTCGAGQAELLAQELHEQQARLDVLFDAPAVHGQADGSSHASSSSSSSAATARSGAVAPMLHTSGRRVQEARELTERRLDCTGCVCAGFWSRRPCSRSRPPPRGPAAACGRPCAWRRRSHAAAPTSPASRSSPTAPPSPPGRRTAPCAPRRALPARPSARRARSPTSSTLAVPDQAVAFGTRALVLLHAQQGTRRHARRLRRSPAPSVGRPEQAAATTTPITEAAGGLRSDGSALAAYAVAAIAHDASRARRAPPPAAGRRPATCRCRAGVTLVQQLQLALAARRQRRAAVPRPGAAAGDVPRPYAACARPRAPGMPRWRSIRRPSVACADLGLAVDAAGTAYAVWSVSDGRVRTSVRPLGGAFAAAQTNALNGADAACAGASDAAGPAGRGAAGLDGRLRSARAAHGGVDACGHGHRRLDDPAEHSDDAREPGALALDGGLGDRHRDDAARALRSAPAPTSWSAPRPRRRGPCRTCAPAWPSRSARLSSRWARSARWRCGWRAT